MSDTSDLSQNQGVGEPDSEASKLLLRLRNGIAEEYDVERELGEGGMAFVYLAKDIKHDRMVAIKVLKPDLASAIGPERFLREIKGAAKLNHPHILPMFDSGEADGLLYYVMPFVAGESLSDLIKREKQLPIEEAVQIAREVAEALSVAHSMGLVHRDIKPDNVMMTGGHAVVADFGIALALDQAGGEKLTQTGMAIGTPAYMSPEQSMAEAVDGRSDIYSLGCMMYEMLVGQIPFMAPTPMAMIAMHTTEYPTPVHVMRDSVPPELENIVFVAMEKTPADRFRTAQHMVDALKAWEQGTAAQIRQSTAMKRVTTGMYGAPQPPVASKKRTAIMGVAALVVVIGGVTIWQVASGRSGDGLIDVGGLDPSNVAVLYFQDLSPDGSLGYIADGFTEGLIDNLAKVRGLEVISRSGVAAFRDPSIPPDSVAQVLQVGSIVYGSVEHAGDQLRVDVRLIDGSSGSRYGGETFQLPADQVLAAQDSMLQNVAELLRRFMGEEVRVRERQRSTSSAQAWSLVQRGERARKEALELEDHDPEDAVAQYEIADSILALAALSDPNWTEPLILRGQITRRRAFLEHEPDDQDRWATMGIAYADSALALDPRDAKALELRGTMKYFSWFYGPEAEPEVADALLSGAGEDLQAAVDAEPSLASAHSMLSLVLYEMGDKPGANLSAVTAYQTDAYLENVESTLWRLFQTSYDLENFGPAKQWCETANQRFPTNADFVACQLWLFTTRSVEADVDIAWQLLTELQELTPEHQWTEQRWGREAHMLVAAALARAGMTDSASNLLVANRGNPDVDPDRALLTLEAFIRTLLGDRDEAIDLLRRYYTSNPHHRAEETEDIHWWWRSIQDDPRYRALRRPAG